MASTLAFHPALAAASAPRARSRRASDPSRATLRSRAPPKRTTRSSPVGTSASSSSSSSSSSVAVADDDTDAIDGVVPAFGPGSPPWPVVHAELKAATRGTVRTISPEEAKRTIDAGGAALADVRPRIEHEEFRPGAAADDDAAATSTSSSSTSSSSSAKYVVNVPYMVQHRSVAKRWQGYMLCTKDGLKERDPTFTRSFAAAFPDKSAPIVVACKSGGDISQEPITIDPTTKRQVIPKGSSQYTDKSKSLSLYAIYELQQAGYTNLYHLDGGVTEWCVRGCEHVGDPFKFYFHPTILPGILFQLIAVEGIVVRSNMAYVKKFHPETFDKINEGNALYAAVNDFMANSPINWMFDYYN